MRYGGGFRALAALLLLGFIGLITAGAYGAGYAAGSGSGASPAPAWAYGGAFGAGHVIGFLLTILVLIIIFRLFMLAVFGHRRRAWGRHGYWRGDFGPEGSASQGGTANWQGGPMGGWHRSEWRQVGQAAFDEFHRQAHGAQQPPAGGGPNPKSGPNPTGPTTPAQ
jgi:hypothetical protein